MKLRRPFAKRSTKTYNLSTTKNKFWILGARNKVLNAIFWGAALFHHIPRKGSPLTRCATFSSFSNRRARRSPRLSTYTPILSKPSTMAARFKDRFVLRFASSLAAFSSYRLLRSYPAVPCQTTGTPVAAAHCYSRTKWILLSGNLALPTDSNQTGSHRS